MKLSEHVEPPAYCRRLFFIMAFLAWHTGIPTVAQRHNEYAVEQSERTSRTDDQHIKGVVPLRRRNT